MPLPAPSTPSRLSPRRPRVASIASAVRLMDASEGAAADSLARHRQLVANLCRILGDQLAGVAASPGPGSTAAPADGPSAPAPAVPLSPRMRQTLERLLAGDSEKEIACRLRLSPHTVHVYVKTLYRRFGVCSRGELFARFVRPAPPP